MTGTAIKFSANYIRAPRFFRSRVSSKRSLLLPPRTFSPNCLIGASFDREERSREQLCLLACRDSVRPACFALIAPFTCNPIEIRLSSVLSHNEGSFWKITGQSSIPRQEAITRSIRNE